MSMLWEPLVDQSSLGAASFRLSPAAWRTAVYTFASLDSTEWILGYSDIYPLRQWGSQGHGDSNGTVPHAINGTTHHRRS